MKAVHRVLLVEDSPTAIVAMQQLLTEMGFLVIGTAKSVRDAEGMVRRTQPDLLISDIRLPDGTGIDLTERLMSTMPLPIVLITAHDADDPQLVFRCIQAGALDVLPKPPAKQDPEYNNYVYQTSRTLRSLAGIPVTHRHIRARSAVPDTPSPAMVAALLSGARPTSQAEGQVIAIGASTGGPSLVADLLRSLKYRPFRFAVVAQHMVPDFIPGFCAWLQSVAGVQVRVATQGEAPESNVVYLVPPNFHLQYAITHRWELLPASAVRSPHVPSINLLFESLAAARLEKVIAILLTGMGSDGAGGLKSLKNAGAHTIVQDPATALISGMPQSAVDSGAACEVLPPESIRRFLRK